MQTDMIWMLKIHQKWKTNFRCALHSATDIKKIETLSGTKMRKQSYRVFQLLEKPDPEKVVQSKLKVD